MSFQVPNKYRIRAHPTLGSDDSAGNNGAFEFSWRGYKIYCIAADGEGWEHVSVHINRNRPPGWDVMCYIKDLFWGEEDIVYQIHSPKSQYVNNHPNVLHLWRPIGAELPPPAIELA